VLKEISFWTRILRNFSASTEGLAS